MKKNIFDEIILSEVRREEFAEVEKVIYHTLESTLLNEKMLAVLGEDAETMLTEEEDKLLAADFLGSRGVAYKITHNQDVIGGVFITFNHVSHSGELVLFGLQPDYQGKGIGQRVWHYIEEFYSNIELWELVTPTAALLNIDFYINKCGFHIVKFMKATESFKWSFFKFEKRHKWKPKISQNF